MAAALNDARPATLRDLVAASGLVAPEALARADRVAGETGERFDAVFSDVVMPGMSGVELRQEIRRLYPHLPVVLTSGYSTVLAESGTHGFELLHKPYSIDELARVLQKVVNWRRDAEERGRPSAGPVTAVGHSQP